MNLPNQSHQNQLDPLSHKKERHGCLTAYLAFILIVNFLIFGFYAVSVVFPLVPLSSFSFLTVDVKTFFLVVTVIQVFHITCIIALLRWKKWGFWGIVVVSLGMFGINLFVGLDIGQSISGLFGMVLLWLILQIGGDKKGWSQLD